MHCEGQVSEIFSDFSTIFDTITDDDYSDEQKAEMLQLLSAQTVDKHLTLIRTFLKLRDDSGELSDIVWLVVEEKGKGKFDCQELFLKLFDNALEDHIDSSSKEKTVFVDSIRVNRVEEDLKRKVDYLVEDNKVLKEELDEKLVLLDNLSEVNRSYCNLKSQLCRTEETCEILNNENSMLRSQLKKVANVVEAKETDFKNRETTLLSDIKYMKELVVDKDSLLKLSEKERGSMFTDFELLSDEIVDRDLVIQSLSETSDNKENIFGQTSNISFQEEDLDRSVKKTDCENCSRRRESHVYFSQLNSTIPRRRGTPSPVFDDSLSLMPDEVVDFSQKRSKSLSDELMEVKLDMENERTHALREIVGRLLFLEVDLRSKRQNLEKSVKVLLKNRKQSPKMMIRYRVTKGKLSKIQFTRYEGVRLPN